jgi:hypothetical protein
MMRNGSAEAGIANSSSASRILNMVIDFVPRR